MKVKHRKDKYVDLSGSLFYARKIDFAEVRARSQVQRLTCRPSVIATSQNRIAHSIKIWGYSSGFWY
jgi:Holliday junction resolvase-like predicted endonuclease